MNSKAMGILLLLSGVKLILAGDCNSGRISINNGNEGIDKENLKNENFEKEFYIIILLPGFRGYKSDPYNISSALKAVKQWNLDRTYLSAIEAYRICESTMTAEVILSTILDTKFISKKDGKFKVIAYLSYLDKESTVIASEILTSENVYLFDVNASNYQLYSDGQKGNLITFAPIRNMIEYFLIHYSWRNIDFVYIGPRKDLFSEIHDFLNYFIESYSDLCLTFHYIHENDTPHMEKVVNTIASNPRKNVIFVYINSRRENGYKFINLIDKQTLSEITWFFNDDLRSAFNNPTYLTKFFTYKNNFNSTVNIESFFHGNNSHIYNLFYNAWEVYSEYQDTAQLFKKFGTISIDYNEWINPTGKLFSIQLHAKHYYSDLQKLNKTDAKIIYWSRNKTTPPISRCRRISCNPGFDQKLKWQKNVGIMKPYVMSTYWECIRCKAGSFKPKSGNGTCKKCSNLLVPDRNRIACVDGYTNTYLKHSDKFGVAILFVVTLGVMLDIFIVFTFIKYKDTPVIKAANFNISLFQVLAHLLLFIMVPFLFLGRPLSWKCKSRYLIIGSLLAAIISVTLAKTQKLVYIFNSKIHHTGMEKFIVNVFDIIVIITIIVGQVLLSITLLFRQTAKLIETLDVRSMTRSISCTTDPQLIFQLGYFIAISLICALLSFRARHLPLYFNETQTIGYATFISSLTILFIYPVYHSRNKEQLKTAIISIALALANLIMISVMYGYKLFIIYFRPNENSKACFRAQMQDHNKKEVDEQLERKQNETGIL